MAFGPRDVLWLASEQFLDRVDPRDGTVTRVEIASLYGGGPGGAIGLAKSPTADTLAVAVFPEDEDNGADVPPLLLLRERPDGSLDTTRVDVDD